MRLAGSRMTREGVLVIDARRHRSQERNREDARDRLAELVRQSLVAPRKRRPTRPSAASRRRRMDTKSRRGETKRLRVAYAMTIELPVLMQFVSLDLRLSYR